jgi:UPF0755 protein
VSDPAFPTRAPEPRRRRLRPGRWLALLLALLVPLAAWWLSGAAEARLSAWLTSPQGEGLSYPLTVEVERGQGASAISRSFSDAGFLPGREREFWVAWLRLTGRHGRLQAGEYELAGPVSPEGLAEMLLEGRVRLHAVTVPEGLTLEQTVATLAETGHWDAAELEAAFRDPALLADFAPGARDLDGYLFPETYNFARGTPAFRVAEVMVERFLAVWAELDGDAAAAALGLSPPEVVTLASLVERETSVPQEHRLVASVFHNRLRRGMKLECDPTTIRALELDGLWTGGPLLLVQLKHESPYNTYWAEGLPPGPIAAPGRASLAAALNPAESRLIFFVADGTGGHAFAEDLKQHQRNVRKWRRIQRGR